MNFNRRIQAFGFAFRGISLMIAREPHARFHLFASIIVVALGYWCTLTVTEWATLCLCMGLVWTAEGINTAIERLADRVTKAPDPMIRDAKDLASGAVLLASIAAAATGAIILLPAILNRLSQ